MEDNKQLLNSIIKKENPSGRLQSLKIRPDLSLGIAKPKKQYTPNLNVVRNKDKTKEILKKNDQKRKERNTNRGRSDKNDKSRFIQSTGVFSQGSGEVKRVSLESRVHVRESGGGRGGGGSGSLIDKPTIKKENWIVDKKEEDSVLEELTNCDSESDDEKSSFEPLQLSATPARTAKPIIIKKNEEFENGLDVKIPEPFNAEYSEENPALCLVKLPDSFAGKGLSDDPNVKKLFDYPLSGMLEGQIGKLLIRKSGKMEVQIGRVRYELRPENTFESIEQLAVISKNVNESHIAVLGNVLNNFVMFPDYDSILKKK